MDKASRFDAEHLRQSEERFRLLIESIRDYAIFMLDTDGKVLTWNAGAERLKGYRAAEIIGQHFSRFYPPEALARGLPEHEIEVAKTAGSFEDEGWRLKKDGSLFWANVVITAMRDPAGRLVGFAKVTRDLTQRRRHEEALRRSEERFRLLVEGVPDHAIFMLDVNGRVATWNVGAQRIKGYAAEEIIGQHFSLFYPPDVRESGWPDYELQVAANQGSFVDDGWRMRKDGTTFWANVTITALRDDAGRLVGFAKLTRDLTQRKRAEAVEFAGQQRDAMLEAERSARMAAQRATRIKDEFLATLSHELRTPLSAILGWTYVLLKAEANLEPRELQRAAEVIDRNARAQVKLIDDLLDLSKVMSGKIALDLQAISMHDVVQAALDSASPSADAKEIRLIARMAPGPTPMVHADSARLQQVLSNLLSNAIKFTPRGGQVEIVLERVGPQIELCVIDNGVGIPASFLPHVFDRFSQKDSSTTRSFGGLGLGLAIAKQLVELHGGTLRAASPGEGEGATFCMALPAVPATLPAEAGPSASGGDASTDAGASDQLAGIHVLVVDDEPDARHLLRWVLEDRGAKVTDFVAAEDALVAMQGIQPAVIVSDIGMPRMDGYQFIRAVRATEVGNERIPALALTAFARAEDREKALLAGFHAHLSKPFDVEELVLLVADLVGR
jgi:PAS domain S-box-containing protein